MMYSCTLFVLMNGPRAPPYLDRLFSSLHQPGHGRPGARAAAFGLRAPAPPNTHRAARLRSSRAGPAAGSGDEGQTGVLQALCTSVRNVTIGGRARHDSQARRRPGEVSAVAFVAFVSSGLARRGRRRGAVYKRYIQRTLR